MVTDFDGNEFVMQKLYYGTILHCNSFLQEDFIHIDLRCATDTQISILRREEFDDIVDSDNDLRRAVLTYESKM